MRSSLWIATVAGVVAAAWRLLEFTGFSNDHYLHVALAQQLLLGDRPIADFTDPGMPLMYLLSAAAWRAGGATVGSEWAVVAAGFAVGTSCLTWVAHRLSGSAWVAGLVAAVAILMTPRSYSYPKILVYGVAGCFILAAAARCSRPRIVLLAATVAVAFLFRHDHGLYVAAAAVACVAASLAAQGRRDAVRGVGLLAAASAAFLAPWLVFLTASGNPVDYVRHGVELSRGEAEETLLRTLPRFAANPGRPILGLAPVAPPLVVRWQAGTDPATRTMLEARHSLTRIEVRDAATSVYDVGDRSAANLGALESDPHVADTEGIARQARPWWRTAAAAVSPFRLAPALHGPRNAEAWLFWLLWLLPVAALTVLAVQAAGTRPERIAGERAAVTAVAVMAVVVNLGFLRNALSARLPDAIVPGAIVAAWLLGLAFARRWRRPWVQAAAAVMAALAVIATLGSVSVIAQLPERFERAGLTEGPRAVVARIGEVRGMLRRPHRELAGSRFSEALLPFFAYLDRCTDPADRLLLTSGYFDVLLTAGRGFGGGSVAFSGGHAPRARQDAAVDRLQRQSVPFVVTPTSGAARFEQEYSTVAAYINGAYRLMTEIPVDGAEPVRILVARQRTPSRLDAETGWPCFLLR